MPVNRDQVTIRLTRDEALVLFDWLHRCEDADTVDQPEHHGEQVALWNLSALLERELVEPFTPHYGRLVDEARERLGGDADGAPDARCAADTGTTRDGRGRRAIGSRSMGYMIMRWPAWARGVLAGVLFAWLMHITLGALGIKWGPPWVWIMGGVVFGISMAVAVARFEKAFDPVDGRPLTADERVQAFQAANHGQPSDDPRVQAAALTFAQQRVRQRGGIPFVAFLFGFVALRAAFGVSENPRWWLLIAIGMVTGPLFITTLRRRHKGAITLLATAAENATKR